MIYTKKGWERETNRSPDVGVWGTSACCATVAPVDFNINTPSHLGALVRTGSDYPFWAPAFLTALSRLWAPLSDIIKHIFTYLSIAWMLIMVADCLPFLACLLLKDILKAIAIPIEYRESPGGCGTSVFW